MTRIHILTDDNAASAGPDGGSGQVICLQFPSLNEITNGSSNVRMIQRFVELIIRRSLSDNAGMIPNAMALSGRKYYGNWNKRFIFADAL